MAAHGFSLVLMNGHPILHGFDGSDRVLIDFLISYLGSRTLNRVFEGF